MKQTTANDIQTEIAEIASAFFFTVRMNGNYWKPEIGQLESIIEIVKFIYETQRLRFDEIVRTTEMTITEERLRTERMLFVSWISLKVLNEIRKTENIVDCTKLDCNEV